MSPKSACTHLLTAAAIACNLLYALTDQQENKTDNPEPRARYDIRYFQHYDKYRKPGSGGQPVTPYRPEVNQRPGGYYGPTTYPGGFYGSNQRPGVAPIPNQPFYGGSQRPGGYYDPKQRPGGYYGANQAPGGYYGANQAPGGYYGPNQIPGGYYGPNQIPGGYYGTNQGPEQYGANNFYRPQEYSSGNIGDLSRYKDKGKGSFTLEKNVAQLKCSLGDEVVSNVIWVKQNEAAAPPANYFNNRPYPGPGHSSIYQDYRRFQPYNDKGEASLTIYNVLPQDSGTYVCIGVLNPLNTNSRINKKVFQKVEFYPDKV